MINLATFNVDSGAGTEAMAGCFPSQTWLRHVAHAGLILILSLLLIIGSIAEAQVVPHPKGCAEDEFYISSQDWWLSTPGEVGQDDEPGEGFGHLHTELCFPHKATITGEMTLNVTSIMHDNPGDFYKVVIQLWQSGLSDMTPESDLSATPTACGEGSAIVCKEFDPPRTLATCETSGGTLIGVATCKWTDTLSFDTSYFPNGGWQQFRVRGKIHQADGTDMRTSTGLHAYISNGNPISHVYENPDRLEGRGWYTDANYAVSNVKDIMTGPVSGLWAPWVEMKQGSGGIPITSHRVALDAAIHAGNLGTELLDGPGPYEGRVLIDTTTLTNGWHTLFLRTSQFEPISGSTNSSVFVFFFEVLNEIPPTCEITHIEPVVADAYVRGGNTYGDDNFGGDDDLIVKSSSDEHYTRYSFLRFDLAGFQASSVDNVTFKAYVHDHQTPGVSVPLKLYAVDDDTWGEDTITWNNQPVAGALLGTVNVSDVGPVEFDITSQLATELVSDNLLSLVLLDDSGTNKMLQLRSRTRENDQPSLEITPSLSECTSSGSDTTPPVITLTGNSSINVVLGSTYTDMGASAIDNVDGNITANIATINPVDVNTVGTYTITYNASDAAGNAAAEVTRTVVVAADTTPPVITLTGNSSVNLVLGITYTDAGATATDNIDGDITASIAIVNPVDVNTAGSYIITYNVSDAVGNAAIEVSRTVNVTNILLTSVFEARIATGADDAEEEETGSRSVDISSSDLELVADGNNGNQTVALRFNNVLIPQGATITNAYISLVADESDSEATSLTIQAEDVDDSQPLSTQSLNLSSRATTDASVVWAPNPWSTNDEIDTPNIAVVVQEVISRNGWSSGNNLALILNGTGKRVAESYNGSANEAALLHVEYALENPVITLLGGRTVIVDLNTSYSDSGASAYDNVDGDLTANIVTFNSVDTSLLGTYEITYNVTDSSANAATEVIRTVFVVDLFVGATVFETRILTGADDAEEKETGSRSVDIGSSDLELVDDGRRGNQTVALRFDNVQIPQGSAITNAYISFVADENDSEPTSLSIQAEAANDSQLLSTQSLNLSSRTTTDASVTWEPIAWSTGDGADTPNISAVVQEVISRDAWLTGSAFTIILTGTGKRVAESYNGSANDAALLHVEYY